MTELKLKPCPFCGELPIINHIKESGALFDCGLFEYWVVCPRCGIRTQRNIKQSIVITTWNRRMQE